MKAEEPAPSSVFDRSGLARLSDLQSEEWQNCFAHLEEVQSAFLSQASVFRSQEYRWPHDPLHTWSRCWEYPYVYHHLRTLRAHMGPAPLLADIGSGVTFFPFASAGLGYQVICTDIDPVCERDIARAAATVPPAMRAVQFRLAHQERLPFIDSEADAACCISVIEHVKDVAKTAAEIARILKPGGILLLTVDLDMLGNSDLSVERHAILLNALNEHFFWRQPPISVHPANVLNSERGPYSLEGPAGFGRAWFRFKQLVKPLLGRKPMRYKAGVHLAVEGFALKKKD